MIRIALISKVFFGGLYLSFVIVEIFWVSFVRLFMMGQEFLLRVCMSILLVFTYKMCICVVLM